MNKCRPEYVAALLTLLLGCCYPCWFSVTRTLLVPLENPALPGMLYPRGTHLPGAKASPLPVVSLILGLAVFQVETECFPRWIVRSVIWTHCVPLLPFSFPFPSFLSLSSLPSVSSLPSFLPSQS